MKIPAFSLSLALLPMISTLAGAAGPRIVGGADAPEGAYPWMTALLVKSEPDLFTAQDCAGSLIHPYWVMTAAHCVEGLNAGDMQVVVGATDLNAAGLTRINVLEIVRHPDHVPGFYDNDVALLLLETPVTTVAPVEIIDDPALVQPDVLATTMGWGSQLEAEEVGTPILKQVQIPIMDSATANLPEYLNGEVTDNMLAAGLPEGGVDTCYGDSGGPLVIRGRQNQWVQAGIISWGDGCAQPMKPGVYTRVSKYRQWIQSYVWPDFAAWEAAAGIDTDSGPDVDGDGASQWLEYALRRDPLVPFDASGFPAAGRDGTAPTLTLRRPAGGGNVSWGLQSSTNLTAWSPLTPAVVGSPLAVPGDTGAEQITWRGADVSPSSFLRAVVKPGTSFVPATRRFIFPGSIDTALHALDTLAGGIHLRNYQLGGLPVGESVTLTARSTAFDAVLRLINTATGAVITTANTNNAGGNDEKIVFTPTAGASYTVQVSTQAAGTTGDIVLAAYQIPAGVPTLSGALPQTRTGSLETTDPADPLFADAIFYGDDFVFTPTTAAAVTITQSSSLYDPSFSIINAETNTLITAGTGVQSVGPALQSFVPTPGVTYYLRASSNLPELTGAYTLKAAATTTLPAGGSRNGSLAAGDGLDSYYAPDSSYYVDDFVLTGAAAGVSRTITVSSTVIDSTLELLDAGTGESLDFNDDPDLADADSVITFTPEAGHSYILRVSSYDELETGAYSISSN